MKMGSRGERGERRLKGLGHGIENACYFMVLIVVLICLLIPSQHRPLLELQSYRTIFNSDAKK